VPIPDMKVMSQQLLKFEAGINVRPRELVDESERATSRTAYSSTGMI
jgi:hypothetical protein